MYRFVCSFLPIFFPSLLNIFVHATLAAMAIPVQLLGRNLNGFQNRHGVFYETSHDSCVTPHATTVQLSKVGHSVSALVLFCCPCIRDEFSAFSTEMVRGFGGFFCYILRETAKISSRQKSQSKISSAKISSYVWDVLVKESTF